ncbi:hypothetical protein SLS59_009599 [Nothophoma quercina]|uniref:lytic cellulose monooxygenase (C4-dehydrogenating) n=1 Tax=Nothophoma quercina TaxID=749835 RepID=A0ABR3QLB9_9PLEO
MRLITSTLMALTAALASAHYNFERLIVNGKTTEPYEYVRALGPMVGNGQYLLRAENVAIHSAGGPDGAGAQFYIGCAQIEASGATGKKPSPVGKFPVIYNSRDPGIYSNPYWPPIVNYTMPGPKVYPDGGSFPTFTADPAKPVATQPLPASFSVPSLLQHLLRKAS